MNNEQDLRVFNVKWPNNKTVILAHIFANPDDGFMWVCRGAFNERYNFTELSKAKTTLRHLGAVIEGDQPPFTQYQHDVLKEASAEIDLKAARVAVIASGLFSEMVELDGEKRAAMFKRLELLLKASAGIVKQTQAIRELLEVTA